MTLPSRSNASTVADRLAEIVGDRHVLSRPSELLVYNSDGLPGYRRQPRLAVFPGSREQAVDVVRLLAEEGLPFVPRGAGTGLSGGALADDIIVIGLHRMKEIISLDIENRRATVEPGVVNLRLNKHVASHGLLYAPDPSSEAACTIGGNVAENAGGPHCLKYGVTLNHVLAMTVVLPSGEVVELGSKFGEHDGYDLRGAFIGSEGCFGLALDITVKLTQRPQTVRTLLADFMSVDAAARVTSAIIASGIVPAALEFMDGPTIRVVEASIYAAGYPKDAEAVLLIELDGLEAGVSADLEVVRRVCIEGGARNVKVARDDAERLKLWQGRKKAFGAMGRLASHLIVQDAVIPRTRLSDILATIHSISEKYGVLVCNVFHAGDGNLHPNIAYSADDPDESERVHKAMTEIMNACIDAGGSITGEHGVGLDKMGYMESIFSEPSLNAMCELRGVFDPNRRANPGKVVPIHSCKEWNAAASARVSPGAGEPRRFRRASAAVSAVSTEAVVAAVREGVANRTPLRIAGHANWLSAGRPVQANKTLSLRDDSGVVSYVPGDLTLTVRAGTTLAEIERITGEHDQWLPLDPFGSNEGTIGATMATASAGPLATSFGLPRDLLLGLEFVNGRGDIVRAGGKVVKNVAGFDLSRLLTGSWGTLGVITEVTVRLYARPKVDRTFAVSLGRGQKSTTELLRAVAASPLAPFALEVLNGAAASSLGFTDNPTLLVRFGGNAPVVDIQLKAFSQLARTDEVDQSTWTAFREMEADAASVIRISTLPTRFLGAAPSILADTEPRIVISINPRLGVMRLVTRDGADRDSLRSADGGIPLDFPSDGQGGATSVIFEKLPADVWPVVSPSVASDPLSRGIKKAYDPHNILNPGILGD